MSTPNNNYSLIQQNNDNSQDKIKFIHTHLTSLDVYSYLLQNLELFHEYT